MVPNRVKLAGIWPKDAPSRSEGDKRRSGEDAGHRSECPGGLLFPPEQLNGATFADGCKPEKNTSTKLVAARIPLPLQGGGELHSGWAARKAAGVFARRYAKKGGLWRNSRLP